MEDGAEAASPCSLPDFLSLWLCLGALSGCLGNLGFWFPFLAQPKEAVCGSLGWADSGWFAGGGGGFVQGVALGWKFLPPCQEAKPISRYNIP